MQPEHVIATIAVSSTAGAVIFGMLLLTIRSIVRANLLAGLKTRCIAAGMNAAEIERVVMVGEGKCSGKYAKKLIDEYDYPLEKAPPVVSSRSYAAAR
jgi:hypothetical protein